MNLKPLHHPFRHLIGEILLDKNSPTAQTIVGKTDSLSSDENKYRILPMEVIAGKEELQTTVTEHGNRFELDLGETYWNSRLQEEHRIMADLVEKDSLVRDLCCGVGPFVIPIAKRGVNVIANDLNPG